MLVIGNRRSKIEIQVEPLSDDEMDDMTEDIVESLLEWQEELDDKIMEIHGVGGFRGAVQKMNSEINFVTAPKHTCVFVTAIYLSCNEELHFHASIDHHTYQRTRASFLRSRGRPRWRRCSQRATPCCCSIDPSV
jgi:hypothetical protein